MKLQILINPQCKGAYFSDVLDVACAELRCVYPDLDIEILVQGSASFLLVDLPIEECSKIIRLSFVQCIFEFCDGNFLRILATHPNFLIPEEIVFGNKYKGKTNELVTQLAINLGLHYAPHVEGKKTKILDPMAGRGTTLLWAARYGIDAVGIEKNPDALEHFCRHVKKQCKLHHIKHKYTKGNIGKKNKDGVGAFHAVEWEHSKNTLIVADSSNLSPNIISERFHVIVTDIPYGIQFLGKNNQRNPLQLIEDCAVSWADRLYAEGIIVIIYNALQPKRNELTDIFVKIGLEVLPFSAPHRMSESIKRDVLVLKKMN